MNPTIQKMQADLQAYRASKTSPAAPTSTPSAPVVDAPVVSPIAADLADYRKQKTSGTLPKTEIPKDSNALADFAKGIFSAPATIIARPFQAAADLGDLIGTNIEAGNARKAGDVSGETAILANDAQNQIKKQTENSGPFGLVAPTPKNAKDVVKDVGRAAETVALGTAAPIAGGALFGLGNSLEQGNNLLSVQTAFDTALGAAGGKVLDLIGKPLLDAAGKVVGTITPEILKGVAAGGAKAVQAFARDHQLLGGIAAPLGNAIQKGAQAIDSGINTAVSKEASIAGKIFKEQFPALDPVKHFIDVNKKDIAMPATVNEPKYAKATAVYNAAKDRGINLDEVATERGIIHDKLAEGGKYNTTDVADALRQENYTDGNTIIRPALESIQHSVPRVKTEQIRGAILKEIHDTPAAQLNDKDRAILERRVTQDYGELSAADKAHPDGYNLTDLYDSRIEAGKRGKYQPGITTTPEVLRAKMARMEENVFRNTFDRSIPEKSGLDGIRKEFEKNFMLADYLDKLHGKKVPEGITKKAVRLFGRAVGGSLGGKIGGFPGFLFGSNIGDALFRSFEVLPNPVKMAVLSKLQVTKNPAFEVLHKYLGDKETARLLQKALPAAGQSSYREPQATIFTTPGGKSTTNKGEAFDVAAVESGAAKAPDTNRKLKSFLDKVEKAQLNPVYTPDNQLPVIKAGTKPKTKKSLNDIF